MVSRKISALFIFGVLVISLFCIPMTASASVDIPEATIVRVGNHMGKVLIQVAANQTGLVVTGRTYYLSPLLGNQGLAVILTAYSMGKTLYLRVGGAGEGGSLISVVHIND